MKGDFSHWQFDPTENFNGVLQQQGRVLLDRDWNEQTLITQHWQDQSGRDVIGAGLAAVPVNAATGFRVIRAVVAGAAPNQRVELRVTPGRVWADGLLCYLRPATPGSLAPVTRVANYLQPPIDNTPGSIATIVPGVRDAVILEVSREELNAFQVPDRLLEPALGGPDTTERMHLRTAFKLFRLAAGETCTSILDALRGDLAGKGRLTVRLEPTVNVPGDCPVVAGGGYTGFEHFLYRIEIAALNPAQHPAFKWSQFNGGLVGRGRLSTTPNRITITANQAAIVNSGLSVFYCEVLDFDEDRGVWFPSFGVHVTLSGSDLVTGIVRLGAFAASTGTVFFRLWNGLEPIANFANAAPVELIDGIQLKFDPATASHYAAGDCWTFPVRAGEIVNPHILIDDHIPFLPVYHRVALAEINWGAPEVAVVPPEIEDCRHRFRPLTRLDTCCTARVGDGERSLGDYESIQTAIDSLPPGGGMVCILPGVYRENVTLDNRVNVTLSGCGPRTRLLGADSNTTGAVITIHGGNALTIESLAVEAPDRGRGILALGLDPFSNSPQIATGPVEGLTLSELHVTSSLLAGIRADFVCDLTIANCVVRMNDIASLERAVVIRADDAHIEHNLIEVAAPGATGDFQPGSLSLGGLHLRSLCERVRVIDNLIRGGSDHGITLGSLTWYFENGDPVPPEIEPRGPDLGPRDPTQPIDNSTDLDPVDIDVFEQIGIGSGGPLYDIRIERNRIHEMGSNGIGGITFFDLSQADEFISVVNLSILGNEIRSCLRRAIAPPSDALQGFIGYGGIALADVENLVVHDNTLIDNGADYLDPVCGIFVLHGEGIDLTRNRILNNGAPTDQSVSGARAGQRGGVVVRYALPPTVLIEALGITAPMQNGVPALRVHGNIVSQPLGRALVAAGVGPMSIVGNQLTSQGVVAPSVDLSSFLAASVQLFNLGMSNELYAQLLLFAMLNKSSSQAYLTGAVEGAAAAGQAGFDDAALARLLANGQVLFSDNQVNLDLLARGLTLSITSTLIVTLDDLGFHDNQCEANLLDDFLLTHSMLLGFSQRVTGNRWKEGAFNSGPAALTLSFFMNCTTDNQGTDCIVVRGFPTHIVDEHNTALVHGVLGESTGVCDVFSTFLPALAKKAPKSISPP